MMDPATPKQKAHRARYMLAHNEEALRRARLKHAKNPTEATARAVEMAIQSVKESRVKVEEMAVE